MLGCDYLEPVRGIGPKTALKLIREHDGLAGVVKFVKGKMADKEAMARAMEPAADEEVEEEEEEEDDEDENIPSDRESEEGVDRDEDVKPSTTTTSPKSKSKPKKTVKSPKIKKVTSSGMQIPEYWPWEEAKKLFLKPDVVKCEDMEVRPPHCASLLIEHMADE